ncbi:hypothetical protein ApAK_02925 [Thermoplasmatales archaeon AK]|nr:hypothetical protein [Thermoplasmatales archaeon AK]
MAHNKFLRRISRFSDQIYTALLLSGLAIVIYITGLGGIFVEVMIGLAIITLVWLALFTVLTR